MLKNCACFVTIVSWKLLDRFVAYSYSTRQRTGTMGFNLLCRSVDIVPRQGRDRNLGLMGSPPTLPQGPAPGKVFHIIFLFPVPLPIAAV